MRSHIWMRGGYWRVETHGTRWQETINQVAKLNAKIDRVRVVTSFHARSEGSDILWMGNDGRDARSDPPR